MRTGNLSFVIEKDTVLKKRRTLLLFYIRSFEEAFSRPPLPMHVGSPMGLQLAGNKCCLRQLRGVSEVFVLGFILTTHLAHTGSLTLVLF